MNAHPSWIFFCRKRFELRSHGFLMGSPEESCLFKLKSLLVIKSRPALQLNTQLPYFYSLYPAVTYAAAQHQGRLF